MNTLNRRDALTLLIAGSAMPGVSLGAHAQSSDVASRESEAITASAISTVLKGKGYFLMIAQWELKPGNFEKAVAIIDQYRPHILAAEGIKLFLFAHDNDDPNHVLFYEAYETEAHYKAHAASAAFKKYILKEGLSLVSKRTLNSYTLL